MYRDKLRQSVRQEHQSGFTAVEVLVVALMLVSISAIALVYFAGQANKSKVSAATAQVATLARYMANTQTNEGTATVSGTSLTTTDASETSNTSALNGASVYVGGIQVGGLSNLLSTAQAGAESDTSVWVSSANWTTTYDTSSKVWGGGSHKITWNITGAGVPYLTSRIPVTAGKTYTLTLMAQKASGTRATNAHIYWYSAATGGTPITTKASTNITSTSWTQVSVSDTAPAGANYAMVVIYGSSGVVGDALRVDAIGFWDGTSSPWTMPGAASTMAVSDKWCVAKQDPTDSTKWIKESSDDAGPTSGTYLFAASACSPS